MSNIQVLLFVCFYFGVVINIKCYVLFIFSCSFVHSLQLCGLRDNCVVGVFNNFTDSFSFKINISVPFQHYLKVHAEKKFVCSKCTMGFGIEHDLKRHLESCGVLYSCGTCPVKYSTKEALLMHCKRGQHVYPEEYQRQTKSQLEKKQ